MTIPERTRALMELWTQKRCFSINNKRSMTDMELSTLKKTHKHIRKQENVSRTEKVRSEPGPKRKRR